MIETLKDDDLFLKNIVLLKKEKKEELVEILKPKKNS